MIRGTRALRFALPAVALAWTAAAISAAETPRYPLLPVDEKAVAERMKQLTEEASEGAKLAAYLDCGTQEATAEDSSVGIKKLQGKPYRFRAENGKVAPTQPTIFFDEDRVAFELSGIERTGRYAAGLTWWDYDAGGRTQMVTVASADKRHVRIAVPAIGLPDYEKSKKPPAQKTIQLPATFAEDGKMRLSVIQVAGPNAVISELWVWKFDK